MANGQFLSQEEARKQISETFKRFGINITPQFLDAMINLFYGGIAGGIKKTEQQVQQTFPSSMGQTGITSSFLAELRPILEFFNKELGIEDLRQRVQDITSQYRTTFEQLEDQRKRVIEGLKAEREAAIKRAEERADLEQRRLLATVGLAPAVGTGVIEMVDELSRRNRESIDLLKSQYDRAIAEFDFQAAERARNELLNLINFQLQLEDYTTRLKQTAMSTGLTTAMQLKTMEIAAQENKIRNALTSLNNILTLYTKPTRWEKLNPQTRQQIESLAKEAGIPIEAIKQNLKQGKPLGYQILTDTSGEYILVYNYGDEVRTQRLGIKAPTTIGTGAVRATTSGSASSVSNPYVQNWLMGNYLGKDVSALDKEGEQAIGNFTQRFQQDNIGQTMLRLRSIFEEYYHKKEKRGAFARKDLPKMLNQALFNVFDDPEFTSFIKANYPNLQNLTKTTTFFTKKISVPQLKMYTAVAYTYQHFKDLAKLYGQKEAERIFIEQVKNLAQQKKHKKEITNFREAFEYFASNHVLDYVNFLLPDSFLFKSLF